MFLLLSLSLMIVACSADCTQCLLEYGRNPVDFAATSSACSAGAELDKCLTNSNCPSYYSAAWPLLCGSLGCPGPCPPVNVCGLCKTALDLSVGAAASLAQLVGGSFDLAQLDQAVCSAFDVLKLCAEQAEKTDNKKCNIVQKNCRALKEICPAYDCKAEPRSLADILLQAQGFKSLIQTEVRSRINEIKEAVQERVQVVGGTIESRWRVVLEAGADLNVALQAFKLQVAKSLGLGPEKVTVTASIASNKRQSGAHIFTATIADPGEISGSSLLLPTVAVLALVALLL